MTTSEAFERLRAERDLLREQRDALAERVSELEAHNHALQTACYKSGVSGWMWLYQECQAWGREKQAERDALATERDHYRENLERVQAHLQHALAERDHLRAALAQAAEP